MALPLPRQVREAIAAAVEPLRVAYPAARWVATDVLHITIHFIGALDPAAVDQIVRRLAAVAGHHQATELAFGEPGSFGGRQRPRVTWVGLSRGGEAIADLAADVANALDATAGPRAMAHLTIARGAPPEATGVLRDRLAAARPIGWTADTVVLYRSFLGPAGPRYEQLASLRLGGAA